MRQWQDIDSGIPWSGPSGRGEEHLHDGHRRYKPGELAEIIAATVLCGELSLGSAIVAEEWVRAHDLLGRNRP